MPVADAGQAFAFVAVDELVRHGVTDAVLAPGSRSTPLAMAFADDERIRLHVRIDERSASFTAVGLARATGRVVPVLCTSGTAAAHFHAAVLECDAARVPLMVLTADRPPELRGTGANQTIDQLKLYGGAVRHFAEVGVPESRPDAVAYWRASISAAVAAAAGVLGPAGPVHLNLALREPLVPTADGPGFPYSLEGRPDGRPWSAGMAAARPLPEDVHRRIEAARRAVVLAGDLPHRAEGQLVAEFAADHGWPLIAEPHSNARRGPAAVVGADALVRNPHFTAEHVPDLVVVCGRLGLSRAVLGWLAATPAEVIVIDPYGGWWDPTRSATTVVAADLSSLGPSTSAAAGEPADHGWLSDWVAAGRAVAAAVDAELDGVGTLTEPRLARELAAGLPDGAQLVVASSMPIRDLDLTMRPRDGLHVLANRGVSGIDGFVSTAVGAALGHDGPTWALAGDLSLLHDVNGLLADPLPDLTLVVVNNDGGGIFSLLPQAAAGLASFERIFGTPHGVDLAQVVTGYAGNHQLLTDVEELTEAVAAPPKGVRVLEVRTERDANAELHRRLTAAADEAVAGWRSRP